MGMTLIGEVVSDRIHEVVMPIKIYEAQEHEMLTWLVDNFGYDEDSGLWDMWEWAANEKVYFTFRFEDHAMAFKLAWT